MKIRKGKMCWCVGNYYRENRKLGVVGSEFENEQAPRFEDFLYKSE